jgi:BirA family biotin operon repressor/biotin-[acetyl-CoA-carboxylase] ligase
LYLSVVLRDSERASGLFALLLGARLADALARAYHVPLRVKWPNDLFVVRPGVPPRKLGGILIDRVLVPDGTVLVAGIGVNVSAPPSAYPTELRGFVASLTEIASPPPSLDEVERIVLEGAIDAARTAADPAQRAETLAACRAALYGIGHHAVVDGVPQGIIRGLAEDGALLVEHGPDLVSIRAGDLRVEGAA